MINLVEVDSVRSGKKLSHLSARLNDPSYWAKYP
jgi:hypothetical protein